MKSLKLPKFDVPELPPKQLSFQAYHAWVLKNLEHLHKTGQLERLRRDPSRTPVSVRFVLK
jgi:hypothetical protein